MSEPRMQETAERIRKLELRVRAIEIDRAAENEKRRKIGEKMEDQWQKNTVA